MNTLDSEPISNDRREDKLQAGLTHVSGISPEKVTIGERVYINFGNMIIKIQRYFGLCVNKIKVTKYALTVENAAQLAFIKGLEKPNVLIQLNDPVEVIKSFGRVQISKNLLVHIDQAEEFVELVCSHKSSGDILHQG